MSTYRNKPPIDWPEPNRTVFFVGLAFLTVILVAAICYAVGVAIG